MHDVDVMNVDEVASYLRLSRNTVYKMAANGSIPSYRVGRKLRFSRRDIDANIAGAAEKKALQSMDIKGLADAVAGAKERKLLLAGDDILASLIGHHITQHGISTCVHPMTSYAGLVNMYAGTADMALVNLYDFRSNAYNTPYVQRLCPGMAVVVVRIARRKQGIHVQAGNPKRISTWGALAREDLRLAVREQGSGAGILQDQKLLGLEASIDEVHGLGTVCETGLEAMTAVAQGAADMCVGFKEEAVAVKGLQFVPLQTECVDLVIRKSPANRKAIRQIKQMVVADAFKAELQRVMECDVSQTGAIVYQC